jgi:ribosomal protein L32E
MKKTRQGTYKVIRIGKKQKSKQTWRRPKGKHGKMREGRGGLKRIRIGLKENNEKNIYVVRNVKDLEKAGKIIIIGRIGNKKRLEIIKKAEELGKEIKNNKKIKEGKQVQAGLKTTE